MLTRVHAVVVVAVAAFVGFAVFSVRGLAR